MMHFILVSLLLRLNRFSTGRLVSESEIPVPKKSVSAWFLLKREKIVSPFEARRILKSLPATNFVSAG